MTKVYNIGIINDKDEVVVESDLLNFKLSAPNYSGRHTVVI